MTHRRIATAALLGSASLFTLSTAAHAQSILFSTNAELTAGTQLDAGREVSVANGTVQVRLPGGGVASFVDSAQFSLRQDGSVDLRSGSVTVVGANGATVSVHMPDGVRGSVTGSGAATFTANATGARGSTTAGTVSVLSNGVTKTFTAGQFWTAAGGRAPDRAIAGSAAAVPGVGPVRSIAEGGVAAAAENGIPVALGEGLAGVGARGDVIAAARRIEAYDADPTIAAFPTGDYALLVQYAAQANGLLGAGGTTFRGAGNDIIRTYFEYLAAGNAGGNFRTAYAQMLLNYLDLLRAGVLPSTFRGATQSQLTAYLAFIGRTDGFGSLSARNRQLLDAYLAFLSTNGSLDAFGASITNLTTSFLNYVRAGNNPANFTQASASVVSQYLAIVQSGGLRTNLTAQNQALLAAYLANNGIGFTTSYATGLAAFVAYLNAGGLPSGYAALPAATVRGYLETLETTGLFDSVLGGQAAFLRNYLTFLRGGGTADGFNALPINVARVNASNLGLYVDYLLAGGAPTAYTALTPAQIRAALDQLTATGQFNALLGVNAAFLDEYYAYIRTGADADTFAGLPSVDVNAYAASLGAFAAYLRAGNLPSGYTALSAQQLRSYLTALQVSGKLTLLGSNATLLGDYLAYIRTGGAPDAFGGLPIVTYAGYATALSAYFAYLNAGGLPSSYAALTQAQLRSYLDVLRANGQFTLLGNNATFYTNYLTYLADGGAVDAFAGLPIVTFQNYATALSAYFAYLNAGGLPSGYTPLSQAQIRQYLDALSANTQLTALLGANAAFFADYRTYLLTGASADAFAGLPIVTFQSYASALNAYYAFLAGGGSPSAYTALSQVQIRSYLDALKTAGQVNGLLGANATFFSQYLAYLETGASANAYPGLPSSTYGQYATALTDYYTFLAGGGLPANYTALTQAQIRQYLDVLAAANQITTLLGPNAAFFTSYQAYLAAGGAPNGFSGLPAITYAQYGTSLSAFVAFLRGNGLPGAYTTLTSAQIREYLAVLQANDQLGLIGSTADQALLTAYAAYLATGGLPNQFAGLPAFVTYETALRTYYAFLEGGGKPSAYSALTQTQIVAYIQALDAAGLVTARLTAAEARFLRDYAAYVSAGNTADGFAGLPGNQAPTLPVVTQGLANAPRGISGNLALASAGKALQTAASTSGNVVLTGNAVSAFSGANGVTTQSAKTVEARTVDGTIAIARLSDGTYNTLVTNSANANEGVHLVWGTPATAVPTTGTVAYGLVTATQPTVDGGAVAPGSFLGNLAVDLASRRVGWDSVIGIGGVTYRFASDGGTATPSLSLVANSNTFSGTASTVNNGLAGTGAGFLSGTGGAYAGFAYTATAPIGAVTGAAIFGKGQPTTTLPAVTYTGAPTGTANLPAPTYAYATGLATTGLFVRSVSPAAQGSSGTTLTLQSGAAVTRAANGALLTSSNASTQDLTRLTAGATNEIYGDARVAIGRWTDGTYRVGPSSAATRTLSPTQGLHYVQLAPGSFVLPTSGQVNYALLAATQPTFNIGGTGAGLFDAKMALAFGSNVKVALEGTIRMPETTGTVTYAFSTPGGVAGVNALPGQTISTAFNVISLVAPLTGSGLACVAACTLNFDGGFGGSDVNRIGATYYTANTSGTSIQGAAIFTGTAATTPGQPSLGYSYTAGLPTTGLGLLGILPESNTQVISQISERVGATPAADGTLSTITGSSASGSYLPITRTSAKSADVAGNARVVVGRWYDGRVSPTGLGAVDLGVNQGYHYALYAPLSFVVPYTGRVDYTLAAATRPTLRSGAVAPGVFDARMAILFRSQPLVGLEGTIVMPETSGPTTYRFSTAGGVTAPSGVTQGDFSRGFFQVDAPMTGTGLACTSNCFFRLQGGLTGADPLAAAATYRTFGSQNGTGDYLTGAASFTGTWVGGEQTVSTVSNRQFTALAPGNSALNPNQGSYDVDGTGRVVGLTNASGLYDRLGSAQIAQSGATASGNLGWTRWSNGSLDLKRLGGVNSVVLNANQGYQILHGAAATGLPTSGIVNYTLTGGTNPTDHAGTLAPGTLGTGAAAVSFGTTSRVAFDFTTTIGGGTYNLFTTGKIAGIANSEIALTNGAFNNVISVGGNVTGSSCAATQCRPIWNGFLAGAGGTELGLNYQVQNTATQFRFGGIAAFTATTAGGAGGGGASSGGSTFTGALNGQTTNAYAGAGLIDYGINRTTYENGQLKSYTSRLNGNTSTAGLIAESGRLADTIGWARWVGDTAGPLNNQSANQGLHLVSGTPTAASTLPTGTVQYTMVGGTKPTLLSGGAAPGTLTGTMGVQFGSLPRIGFDLTATVGDFGWRVQTKGGSANPSTSEISYQPSSLTFNSALGKTTGVTPLTAASCVNSCTANVEGQFYGPGASHIGVSFNMTDNAPTGVAQVSAIGIFAKAP